jgi:hypothetical protein
VSAGTELVIGAPVWDRGWALPLWFEAVRANCEPDKTGLLFVVPGNDLISRESIFERCEDFAWCEVLRDKNPTYDRTTRQATRHKSLAMARNQLLQHVNQVRPDFYLSWDTDLLISPNIIPFLMEMRLPIQTVWTWLNRKAPRPTQYSQPEDGRLRPVFIQEAMQATAMEWEAPGRAIHLDGENWDRYASGHWRADVVLALKLMTRTVYSAATYQPSPYGEDIPFNWQLHQRGIPRYCYGEKPGVHLFERQQSMTEIQMGYPKIMQLAKQKPLAARYPDRPVDYQMLGLFDAT